MNPFERKRRRSSWSILGISTLGLVLANVFNTPTVADDTVAVFAAIMALSMLVGIVGLIAD